MGGIHDTSRGVGHSEYSSCQRLGAVAAGPPRSRWSIQTVHGFTVTKPIQSTTAPRLVLERAAYRDFRAARSLP